MIGESSIGSLFNQNLKAGTYQLSHIASEVPTAESIDCKDLGKACEWLKSKLFHPEKLTIKLAKSTRIDAHAKPASFLMLDFDGAKRQFVTLDKEANPYYKNKPLQQKKREHDNLLTSHLDLANMKLIAKDRDSARRSNSSSDAMIKAKLPKGEYLIKVIDSKSILSGSHLKYMLNIVKVRK